jgi:Family of unknown function (DUF6455)
MDTPVPREGQPIYLFEMMERLGIEPGGGVVPRLSLTYATAFHRCEACPSKQTCRDWLDRMPRSVAVAPSFCPNADILCELQVDLPISNHTRTDIALENIMKGARDHGCRFLFDGLSSKSTFVKLPGRWHELIDNLCTILGRETPGTEDFRINIDHEISEAEARASQSEAIPFGETPEQRKQEFQEALRKILRVSQDRNSSNKKVWTEALHLLDNPRVRSQTISDRNENHEPFFNSIGRVEMWRGGFR